MEVKTVTQYVANDGTIFDNMDDCYYYEMITNLDTLLNNGVRLYDATGEKLTRDEVIDEYLVVSSDRYSELAINFLIGYVYYIYVPKMVDEKTKEKIINATNYFFGDNSPFFENRYIDADRELFFSGEEYNDCSNICWDELKEMITFYTHQIEVMKEVD